jgi:hypothetical protein
MDRKNRFSLMEAFIVVAIILIIAPIMRPRVLSATVAPVRDFFHQHVTR